MKSISQILTTLLTILLMSFCNNVSAQNIDSNRMNRDINIMENVLQEMFKTNMKGSADRLASATFSFGSSNNIRGTHLPGYGIIFSIPGIQRGFLTVNSDDGKDSYAYVFQYSDGSDEDQEVTKESIISRIKEFLREYGSTIGQLQNDEKIMVIYNSGSRSNTVTFFNASGMKKSSSELPTISVVIKKDDLNAFRSGSISKTELDERFSVSTVEEGDKEQLDLKVMANIFETALKDPEKESFRIRGNANYLKLDNFGAVFSMTVNYGSPVHLAGTFQVRAMNTARLELIKDAGDSTVVVEARKKAKEAKRKQEEREQDEKDAYQTFLTDIKEYLVDYGRTLNSVSSDQYILISTTVSSRVDDIPERVDFQVKKSVLETMDRGNMNRDEVINQITVREY